MAGSHPGGRPTRPHQHSFATDDHDHAAGPRRRPRRRPDRACRFRRCPRPGLFDVAGRIRAAINSWLRDLVARAIDPAVDLAARSVLATPNLAAPGGRVRELWALSVGLANAGYVLLVCAGGVLLMTNETLQARYTIKDVAPRLVVGLVASNTSLLLVGVGIDLANALSRALLGPGVDPAQARATLKAVLVFPLDDANVLLTLVALVVVVLALILGASYVLRVAVLVGLTVAGPLALAGHALPQTEALARWWWRGDRPPVWPSRSPNRWR